MTTASDILSKVLPGKRIAHKDTKILTMDIERLPGLARAWGPKTRYIAPRDFITWPRTLCLAGRWYGQDEMMFLSTWEHGHEGMIRKAWEWFDRADMVVGFNSIGFDEKHLASDWLVYDMGMPSPWKSIDLLLAIRRRFGFESKSLDSMTRRLGREGKHTFYDATMAEMAAGGDEESQRLLREYNSGDVELTEWLYDRLRGYMPEHPVLGSMTREDPACNQCGSTDLKLMPQAYRAIVMSYDLWQCRHCGGYSRAGWAPSRFAHARGVG